MRRLMPLLALLLGTGLAASDEPVLLRGRITSAKDGSAVKGATVTVWRWHDVVEEDWTGKRPRAVDAEPTAPAYVRESDADGAFALPVGEVDGPVTTVAAKGYASVTWYEGAGGAGVRRDIVLPAAATLTGRVVRADGTPVWGVHVYAVEWSALDLEENPGPLAAAADLLWGRGQYDDDIAFRYVSAITDRDGRFHIPDADAAKRYAVLAASQSRGPSMLPEPVVPGAPLGDLKLDAATTVRVRIVNEKGEPIVPRKIEIRASPREIVWDVGEDGACSVGPVGPGFNILDISIPGYLRHDFVLPRDARGFETTVDVSEGFAVSGLVLDAEDNPVVGARVNVQATDAKTRQPRSTSLHTDAEGKFKAPDRALGIVWIDVVAKGYQEAHFNNPNRPTTNLRLRLRRARAVTLEVRPPQEAPQRSLVVAVRSLEEGGGGWTSIGQMDEEEEGRVTIHGVPLGRAAIRLWSPGCALYEREIVEPGADPIALDPARLEPVPTVTVRLVDEEGCPVPGLKVHAEFAHCPPLDWAEFQRTTGSDGKALLELHEKGPIIVHVEAGERERVRRVIELPAESGIVVDVRAGDRIR